MPPRPTFTSDMTQDERAVMQAHQTYLLGLAAKGSAVAFGPVLDPRGSWGVGIFTVESAEEIEAITRNDPAILSGRGFSYEILPMAALVVAGPT
jgi:uncharacterized protein